MEAKWRRERAELYEKLEGSAKNGLNRDAVLASRALFDVDTSGRATPKEFEFQHEDDAVNVVLKALRGELKEGETGEETQTTDVKDVYVSDERIMHVTLFYTSHPDDLAPRNADEHKTERLAREISLLRELATQFEPIRIVPVKVVLAASGAVLLHLQCVQGDARGNANAEQPAANAGHRAEFSVDLLRQAAREKFPFVSKKSPSVIIHTTLARVLIPDALDEDALHRVRETCHLISQQLASATPFVVNKLWYVDESHYIRPAGHTTTVTLGA